MERKLDVGATLSEVFSTYGAQAGILLPVAFWLFLVVAIVDGIVGKHLALFSARDRGQHRRRHALPGHGRRPRPRRPGRSPRLLRRRALRLRDPRAAAADRRRHPLRPGHRHRPGAADRPGPVPADDLVGDRAGDRDRAQRRLRRLRPLARARPRQRLAGLLGDRGRLPDRRSSAPSSSAGSPPASPTVRSSASSSAPSPRRSRRRSAPSSPASSTSACWRSTAPPSPRSIPERHRSPAPVV